MAKEFFFDKLEWWDHKALGIRVMLSLIILLPPPLLFFAGNRNKSDTVSSSNNKLQ